MGPLRKIVAGTCLALIMNAGFAGTENPDLPAPEILTKKYLEEISERKIGQSRFASKGYGPQSPQSQQQQQQSESRDGGSREIQEADVFKLGKTGHKELFLLNNYRGFQVVSFEDGLERPKLIGRLPIYNNWSSEMYYLEARNQVVILNTEWAGTGYGESGYQTALYLIDVSDSSAPKLKEKMFVSGYLSESRLVGDVLYTITSNWNRSQQKASIHSVLLSNGTLAKISETDLQGDKEYVQTMNVVQSKDKYYVISTLTNWNSAGDKVNVHDISSPAGDIHKLFSARARGRMRERSNTFIHRDHLFTVSNYQLNTNSPMRISIEAIPMTASGDDVVSKDNMRLSIGDTTGLHASLQDVRVSGDLLYAFWVPANNIDPFELIDISNPAKGLKHLGQLQFDGWISKAFPVEVDGKKYVIGLGEIVPVTQENGKRFPQAKIFEIKNVDGKYRHETVASLTLESEDVWSNLNSEDKYFEIVQDRPGVFDILFPVYFRKNWSEGGKVVTADLNRSTLSEGAAIAGESGWLRRVFLNREVQSLHAFSDLRLESFRQTDMRGQGFARSVSALELARDVVDFQVVSKTEGIQVVKNGNEVELRRVSLAHTDAEKTDVLSTISVKGKYEWHKIRDGKAFIVSTFTKKETRTYGNDYSYEIEIFDHANLTVVDLETRNMITDRIETSRPEGEYSHYYYFEIQAIQYANEEILKINNEFFKLVGNSMKRLQIEESCKYFFDNKSQSFSLETVGNEIYAFTTFNVKANDSQDYFDLPFTKKVSLSDSMVKCSASVNVPGRPVFTTNELLITSNLSSRWYYYGPLHYEYYSDYGHGRDYHYAENKTFSLKYTGPQEATLMDILDKDISNGVYNGGFLTYDSKESRVDIWRLSPEGEFLVRPQFLGLSREQSSMITLKNLNGKNFLFMKDGLSINLFEVVKNSKVTKIPVTSSYDTNSENDSAENVFAIQNISASEDGSRFHISQGLYGVTDIILK